MECPGLARPRHDADESIHPLLACIAPTTITRSLIHSPLATPLNQALPIVRATAISRRSTVSRWFK